MLYSSVFRTTLLFFMLNCSAIKPHLTLHHPIFAAKFYDETGTYLGSIGKIDSQSAVYVVACRILFPEKYEQNNLKIAPQNIVEAIGTELIYDRKEAVIELKTHITVFKLPPKAHRDSIKKCIEQVHFDAQILNKIDSIDYEIGGCGYHNNVGTFLHLRAEDGKPSVGGKNPSVEVFNALDFYSKIDENHQLITSNGSKLIAERRIEYTWHTHPPKTNTTLLQQSPSVHDFNFANSYQYIKQHFLISVKYKTVYYYGFGMHLLDGNNVGESGPYNFKISYDDFFSLN